MNEPIEFNNKIDPSQDIRIRQTKAATFGGGKYRIDYDRHQNPSSKAETDDAKKNRSILTVVAALVCLFAFILCGVLILRYFESSIRTKIDSSNENYSLVACYESTENIKKLAD